MREQSGYMGADFFLHLLLTKKIKHMKRKTFNRLLFAGAGIAVASCSVPLKVGEDKSNTIKEPLKLKPKRLKAGDTIGLIAPGSAFSEEAYERTIENIESLGLNYKNAQNLFKSYGYVAGTDKERIDDIHEMFADKEVDAIWCVRGGYGTTRIIENLDYKLIKNNPKIIVGYSDITALLQAIHVSTGLITFHGPVGASELKPYTLEQFRKVLFENKEKLRIPIYKNEDSEDTAFIPSIIVKGKMRGELIGGNLSLLSSLSGTKYNLNLKDKIVFIEDVGEKPYRIDRMLTQLINSTDISKSAGILLGIFNDCDVKPGTEGTLRLMDTLKDRLEPLGVPVFYGFSFGHIKNMCTLPVGIEAEFDMGNKELVLLENAVI